MLSLKVPLSIQQFFPFSPKLRHGLGLWAYGAVVSIFDFHRSDRGSNPGRGSKIS